MKKNESCTFIILGATGDLSKRKLIPAIYRLLVDKKIKDFAIIGAAITETTTQEILSNSKRFVKHCDDVVWRKLEENFYYHSLNFDDEEGFEELKSLIEEVEEKNKLSGNRIFYLATMPEHFYGISKYLSQCCIVKNENKKTSPWTRVVYEKPFGHDLQSAQKINKCITKVFDEDQIYRIDHYLGEELVGNIALVRFANIFLQPLWNREYIDSVQIILSEKIGVEGRGKFYDRSGALKDVVQNHMLQLLALVSMEQPKALSGEYIRDAKSEVLSKIKVKEAILGQYDGYRDEKDVDENSQTETFAFLQVAIDNDRWKGVPFYLKTGKNLEKKESSIHIKFKQPECLLGNCSLMKNNWLTISVQPREGFFLEVNAKVPGITYETTPVKMEFCHGCLFGPNTPQAYEVLLYDVLRGDHSVFVRFDEIEHSWRIVEQVIKKKKSVYSYDKNSKGPKELDEYSKKHNIEWRL